MCVNQDSLVQGHQTQSYTGTHKTLTCRCVNLGRVSEELRKCSAFVKLCTFNLFCHFECLLFECHCLLCFYLGVFPCFLYVWICLGVSGDYHYQQCGVLMPARHLLTLVVISSMVVWCMLDTSWHWRLSAVWWHNACQTPHNTGGYQQCGGLLPARHLTTMVIISSVVVWCLPNT